jgi:hypothetical protein
MGEMGAWKVGAVQFGWDGEEIRGERRILFAEVGVYARMGARWRRMR